MQEMIYISAGSNQHSRLGSPRETVARAPALLAIHFGIASHDLRVSSIYMTEPQLYKNQPWFANLVVEMPIVPKITPFTLLQSLQALEEEAGRTRLTEVERYGPRALDLDVLLFGRIVCSSDTLTLPHPHLVARAFVLAPLAELAPDLLLPIHGFSVREALARLSCQVDGQRIFQA